ncbi:ribonuclease E inhibitor RraB [Hyphomicrobium sp. CS1BSMeth3]|uniref:ribonuclease E inhibitor RraB n=1 Tax=Hyphomicrobium sp. CS1BSMeth3 TaxID=1892844 RepID=UPI0009307DEB|nr:ribonuclease E inhibitor RraB [Hyphomicrobium sp. CS1BSMeth3]
MSEEDDIITYLVAQGADLAVPRSVRHYVYMPTKEAAGSVASELRNRGYATEVSPAALGSAWLVLACHDVVVSARGAAAVRRLMEALIKEHGCGEYDGWDAALHGHEVRPKPN